MKFILWCVFVITFMAVVPAGFAAISDFEDLDLADETCWKESDLYGGFTSGNASYPNTYTTLKCGGTLWEGWAYSNQTDATTAGYANQYSVITGAGAEGTTNYGIARDILLFGGGGSPTVTSGKTSTEEINSTVISGAYFTNTTFPYLATMNGRFSVPEFDAGDWQMITITGIDADGNYTTNTVDFYLADDASADMTSLSEIVGFKIDFFGSQIWIPHYVAMDELNTAPIPGAVWMLGCGLLGLFGFRKRRVG